MFSHTYRWTKHYTCIGLDAIFMRIENLTLLMLSYQGCHMRAVHVQKTCIGTRAHGRQVTSLLC